ncbi:MAG: hypothetical protein KDA44_21120 [Planctomycetales bacterium]|nr:hypothetical protein [Planctomycetales bacterium]
MRFPLCSLVFASAFALTPSVGSAAVDFAAQIQPLFVQHCAKCHGQEKGLGKLRLHTAEAIQASPHDDLAIAGKPEESEIYKRLVLPADDKKRMPKGADPLSAEEIELVKQWIAEGAVFASVPPAEAASAATPPAAESMTPPANGPSDEELQAELATVAAAPREAIAALSEAGASVLPLFANSPLLEVSFAQSAEPADDAALAVLAGVADQVASLNLAGAQATVDGYAVLGQLKHLQHLHLEKSTVNAAGLAPLAGNRHLEYLNLYGTQVGDDAIPTLRALPRLQRLYLWQAPVDYDAAMTLHETNPALVIDMGWNHPRVLRERLSKELAQARETAEKAKAEIETLQKQLDAAKALEESANAAAAAAEEQLKKLDAPESGGAETPAVEPAADAPAAAQ